MNLKPLWPGIIWAILILALCGIPGKDVPKINLWDINYYDKLAHTGIFAVQGFLLYRGAKMYQPHSVVYRFTFVLILTVCVLFAAFTELMQKFLFVDRSADVVDFIADSIGSFLGIVIAKIVLKKP